ncbi:MAG: hypothetical protein NC453_22365 [Muribaculum sp.]|nr:hypothetical protein [Muribaculum sp.]
MKTPAITNNKANSRMNDIGIIAESNNPKLSITKLNVNCPNNGNIVVCNCPNDLNMNITIVMVLKAITPPHQLHQGVVDICVEVGITGRPSTTDHTTKMARDTMKEIIDTTNAGPITLLNLEFAAV